MSWQKKLLKRAMQNPQTATVMALAGGWGALSTDQIIKTSN